LADDGLRRLAAPVCAAWAAAATRFFVFGAIVPKNEARQKSDEQYSRDRCFLENFFVGL